MTQLPGPEEPQTFTIIRGRLDIHLPPWMLSPGPWTPRCPVCKGQNGRVDRQIEGGRRGISLGIGLTLLPAPGEEQYPQHLGLTPIHLNLVYDLGPSCCAALLPWDAHPLGCPAPAIPNSYPWQSVRQTLSITRIIFSRGAVSGSEVPWDAVPSRLWSWGTQL